LKVVLNFSLLKAYYIDHSDIVIGV
jgi:hypothetical protein